MVRIRRGMAYIVARGIEWRMSEAAHCWRARRGAVQRGRMRTAARGRRAARAYAEGVAPKVRSAFITCNNVQTRPSVGSQTPRC